MKIYKLTDQEMKTKNGFQWKLGKWYKTNGRGDLCGKGWLHFCTHPLLAVLLNPIHADIENPRLFLAEGEGVCKTDNGLKVGYIKAKIIKELPMPEITTTQRVAFGILCALEVCKDEKFVTWAKNWLSGNNRTEMAAWAAAWAAADTAADAAEAAAARNKPIDLVKIAKKAMEIK